MVTGLLVSGGLVVGLKVSGCMLSLVNFEHDQ